MLAFPYWIQLLSIHLFTFIYSLACFLDRPNSWTSLRDQHGFSEFWAAISYLVTHTFWRDQFRSRLRWPLGAIMTLFTICYYLLTCLRYYLRQTNWLKYSPGCNDEYAQEKNVSLSVAGSNEPWFHSNFRKLNRSPLNSIHLPVCKSLLLAENIPECA